MISSILSVSCPEATEAQGVFPRCDVNGDGLVNLADAMLIRQVLQGVRSMSDIAGFMNGDVNFDGATNATDAKMIAQYVAGLRDLPTPPAHTQKLLFYHTDHLGGSNIITDGSGNLVQHVQYSPYGEIDYELNLGVSVNYLFTGQEFDREAGLYYYNARYYDPEIGRFIQPDTIIPDPSDNQAYNRYSYCRNNPIMLTDPSGHMWDPTEWIEDQIRDGSEAIEDLHYDIQEQVVKAVPNEANPVIAAAVGAVVSYYAGPIAGGAAAGTAGSYLNGGRIRDDLFSASVGAVVGGIMSWAGSMANSGVGGGASAGGAGAGLTQAAISTGGAWAGGAVGGMAYAAYYGGDIGDAAWKGALVNAIGQTAGGLVNNNFPMGDYVRGAVAGAMCSAAGAALNGENIGDAMLKGAAMGAITIAVLTTIQASQLANGGTQAQASVFEGREWFGGCGWIKHIPILRNIAPLYHRYFITRGNLSFFGKNVSYTLRIEFDKTTFMPFWSPGEVFINKPGCSITSSLSSIYGANPHMVSSNAIAAHLNPPQYGVLSTGGLSAISQIFGTYNCQSFSSKLF